MIDDDTLDKLRGIGIEKTRRRIDSNRRQLIFERDGGKCRYCGKSVEYKDFHLDHILPRYYWGNDYVFNLCVSCPDCNMNKGADRSIIPEPLTFVKRLFELYLIWKYQDFPKIKDFI